jgi:hypothetical protein
MIMAESPGELFGTVENFCENAKQTILPSIVVATTLFAAMGVILVIRLFDILCFHKTFPSLLFTAVTTP